MSLTREMVRRHPNVVQLGDVVDFLDHKRRPVKESDRTPGSVPYYGANGQQGTIDKHIFDEPLLLMAEDGGHFDEPQRGIAYRIEGRTWVNNHAHVLRPRSSVDLGYLQRVLENYDIRPFISGTTRGKLTKAQAERIELPLPPIDEQRRIAAILDKTDALRQKRKRAIALLDSLTQSIFLEMFGQVDVNDRGWPDDTRLEEVASIGSGITKGRPDRGAKLREVPYMAVANVQERALDLSTVKYISASEAEIDKFRLRANDLLLTEGGDPDKLGRGTLWRDELPEAIHQNHIFRVRITSDHLDPMFANWLIGSSRGKKYFLKAAKKTTGIASINRTQLSSFPMLMPPISLQREFAAAAEKVSEAVAMARGVSQKIEALFNSLQLRAFAGEL